MAWPSVVFLEHRMMNDGCCHKAKTVITGLPTVKRTNVFDSEKFEPRFVLFAVFREIRGSVVWAAEEASTKYANNPKPVEFDC